MNAGTFKYYEDDSFGEDIQVTVKTSFIRKEDGLYLRTIRLSKYGKDISEHLIYKEPELLFDEPGKQVIVWGPLFN